MKNTSWLYKGKHVESLEDLISHSECESVDGFVYKITNTTTGKIYIGKKTLVHSKKTKISKKEKTLTNTRKVYKIVQKESDWKNYYGSCAELKQDIEALGSKYFLREILEFCTGKKRLSYLEVKYMFLYNVLESDTYNSNILTRFFRKDFE